MAQCVHHVGREPTRFPERTFSNSIAFGSSRLGFPNIQMRFSPVGLRGSGKSNQGSFQASGGQRHTSSLSTETASTSSRLTGRPPHPLRQPSLLVCFAFLGFSFSVVDSAPGSRHGLNSTGFRWCGSLSLSLSLSRDGASSSIIRPAIDKIRASERAKDRVRERERERDPSAPSKSTPIYGGPVLVAFGTS